MTTFFMKNYIEIFKKQKDMNLLSKTLIFYTQQCLIYINVGLIN